MEKKTKYLIIFIILLAGFLLRVFLVDKSVVGDMLVNAEWGQKIVEGGTKAQYYRSDWYYTPPVYPPFSQLFFGGAYYLFENKYVIAQLHNQIKFPPSSFIIYFYKYGYYLLLKLPGILADLGLSIIVYKVILKLTGNIKKSFLGMSFYIFNPVAIFLSGVWGQTDSFVALLSIASFLLLNSGNVFISMPILLLSLYFKPSWAIFIPLYIFMIYIRKPSTKSIIFGMIASLVVFLIITIPFAQGSVIDFTWSLWTQKIPLPIGLIGKASNSAFNLYTIFTKIDITPSPKYLGLLFYLFINIFAFGVVKKQKNTILGLFTALFIIGIGTFLFMTSMLERYFFPGLVPFIILTFSRPKLFLSLIAMNIVFFANIIWSFYRRTSDEIGRPFVENNFLLIRILSLIQVWMYLSVSKMVQFKRE